MTDEPLDMIDMLDAYRPWTMEYIIGGGDVEECSPIWGLSIEGGDVRYKAIVEDGYCIDSDAIVYEEYFQSKQAAIDGKN